MRNLWNLLAELPADRLAEAVETLVEDEHVRLERIVSYGQASPAGFWYDQPRHELVVVLQGEATLRFEADQRVLHLKAGDAVNIRAHERHRVDWTHPDEPTICLAVHYGGNVNSGSD